MEHHATLSLCAEPTPPMNRSSAALLSAQQQLEAICGAIVGCARQQRGEIIGWPDFDAQLLPDIVRALAIRGRELAMATSSALDDPGCAEDCERVVAHGGG